MDQSKCPKFLPLAQSAFPLADMATINRSRLSLSDSEAHKSHQIICTAFPQAVSMMILSSSPGRYCSIATFYRWSLNFPIKSFRYSNAVLKMVRSTCSRFLNVFLSMIIFYGFLSLCDLMESRPCLWDKRKLFKKIFLNRVEKEKA